ncbi:MAG: hypothetical protein GY738_25880, partial [Pseudoalteromonas sp.]|nr:hypothetical protein [Pseudoalteromonas sp.]
MTEQYQFLASETGLLGDISKHIVEIPQFLGDEMAMIEVQSVSLNFRDVLTAMHHYREYKKTTNKLALCTDCSGVLVASSMHWHIVNSGVFAFQDGCLRSVATTDSTNISLTPRWAELHDMSSLNCVFCTNFDGLMRMTLLTVNMTILLHIASRGLGTSATQIAKNAKTCQATTVGSRLKWVHATGNNITTVGNPRIPTFLKQWPNIFSNVLNSLTSLGYIDSSLYSMEKNSSFTEVGKNTIWSMCKMTSSSVSTEAGSIALEQESGSRGSGITTLCLE